MTTPIGPRTKARILILARQNMGIHEIFRELGGVHTRGQISGICSRAGQQIGGGKRRKRTAVDIVAALDDPRPVRAGPGCRYIAGEPRGADTVFCDKRPKSGSAYCTECHARCYVRHVFRTPEERAARGGAE